MLTKYNDFQQLPVWELSHKSTLEVYDLTQKFPKEEQYGLISQIRRSAASVPANIVEGLYRHTTKELIKFLYNARGSAGETKYHLLLAKDLGYISEKELLKMEEDYESIAKQINSWIKSLRNKNSFPPSTISHQPSVIK